MKAKFATSILLAGLTLPVIGQVGVSSEMGGSAQPSVEVDGRGASTGISGKANADVTQPGASDLSNDKTNINRKTTDQDLHDEAIQNTGKTKHGASNGSKKKPPQDREAAERRARELPPPPADGGTRL